MSTCVLFLLPFATAFNKVWILLLKKPNSHWCRVNTWVNFWQFNQIISCVKVIHIDHQTESIKLHAENTITIWISELRSLPYDIASMLTFSPRVIIAPVLHPEWKRSIKGSLLTSRFCKCYGLVKESWPSLVFNCSCNSNVEKMKASESVSKERRL